MTKLVYAIPLVLALVGMMQLAHATTPYQSGYLGGIADVLFVAPLEINSVREAKNPRVLFRLLEAGPFEAGMLECVNPSYPRVLVEFSTDTAQESKAATHIENPQLLISHKLKRSEGFGKHSLHDYTCLLGSH